MTASPSPEGREAPQALAQAAPPSARPRIRLREAVLLGLLQGPTEVVPVSSSAHVAAIPLLLGWEVARLDGTERKEIEVALHAGTALALALRGPGRPGPGFAALTVGPAALAGALLEGPIERRLRGPAALAVGLLAGSAALVLADVRPHERGRPAAGALDALMIGVAQACALVPGVSRSGATTAAARARGFSRPAAADLSRQAALPVLAAATALKGLRLFQRRADAPTLAILAAGAGAAAASTALALGARGALARVPLGVWAAERAGLAVCLVRHNRPR